MLKIHSGRLQIRGKGGGVPYDFMEVSQSEHENLALYVSLLCDSKKTSSWIPLAKPSCRYVNYLSETILTRHRHVIRSGRDLTSKAIRYIITIPMGL